MSVTKWITQQAFPIKQGVSHNKGKEYGSNMNIFVEKQKNLPFKKMYRVGILEQEASGYQ